METLRGLMMGTPIGSSWLQAIDWCCAIALAGYLWARSAFRREPRL